MTDPLMQRVPCPPAPAKATPQRANAALVAVVAANAAAAAQGLARQRRAAQSAAARQRFQDPAQRALLSEAMSRFARLVVVEGVTFPSIKAAHRDTGIAKSTIRDRLKAKAPGYSYAD